MTKKDAAARLFRIADLIHRDLAGDDSADLWVMMLEGIAHDLDPKNLRYLEGVFREPVTSKKVKLRRLIDHPNTSGPEREAAILALLRLGEQP